MYIGVIGAGSMGHGIAQVSAMAEHEVVLRDVEDKLVKSGLARIRENLEGAVERDKLEATAVDPVLDRIAGTTSIADAVGAADLVIEAVPEHMDLKKEVFEDCEAHAPADAVIATNTSSLSVTELSSVLDDATRSIGLHFFKPVHLMPIVEIVRAERTADAVEAFALDYVRSIEKEPAVVEDFPGFASSRLGAALYVEAVRMVQEGVATPEDIDRSMRLGFNHRMGPLESIDHTGVDVNLDVLQYLWEELGERFRPPQLLKQKDRAGKLGRKTGEGFYVWEDGEIVGMSGFESSHEDA